MKKFRKAFTIVELVIVIAVVAILAAVLITTFSNVIQNANESADLQVVSDLNVQLKLHLVENEIDDKYDLWDFLEKTYKNKNIEEVLTPNSAKKGNHIWYNVQDKKFEIINENQFDESGKIETERMSRNVYSGNSSFAKLSGNTNHKFNEHDPRLFFNKYYFLDKGGNKLSYFINQIDNVNATSYIETVNTAKTLSVENVFMKELYISLQNSVIINDMGKFACTEAPLNCYIPMIDVEKEENKDYTLSRSVFCYNNSGNEYDDTVTTLDLSQIEEVVLPDGITVGSFSLNGFKDDENLPKLYVNLTAEELEKVFHGSSTDLIIVLPDNSQYIVEGTNVYKYPKVENDGRVNAEDLIYTIEFKDFNIDCEAAAKKTYLEKNNQGYNLYVAENYKGIITLSISEFIGKGEKEFSENDKEMFIKDATYSTNSTNIEIDEGKVTIKGFSSDINAQAGTITIKVLGEEKIINVYGVKAVGATVDHDNITIENDQPSMILLYDSGIFTYDIVPSVVLNYNHLKAYFDLEGDLSVITDQDVMTFDNNKLSLVKNTLTTDQTTTFTVSYKYKVGDKEITVSDNLTYTVNWKHNDTYFDINDAYVTTVNYDLNGYVVGNTGSFKLKYLFKVKDGKDISGKKIVVDLPNGQKKYDNLESALDLSSITINGLENGKLKIKIGLDGWVARTEFEVKLVAATNITADNVSDMPSSATSDVVLLSDISLTTNKTLRNIYGNLHIIDASDFLSTKASNYWDAFIALKGTMDNVVLLGPVYPSFGDGYSGVSAEYGWDGVKLNAANAVIQNSYIFGFRAPVSTNGSGTGTTIKNSIIEGGTLANIHASGTLVIEDSSLVQDKSGYAVKGDSSKEVYGMGVYCDNGGSGTITIKGTTKFYNWICVSEANNINYSESLLNSIASTNDVVEKMIEKGSIFVHYKDGDTTTQYINTGVIMNGVSASGSCGDTTYTYPMTFDDQTGTFSAEGVEITVTVQVVVTNGYKGYSYGQCDSKVGSVEHPILPTGWSHQSTNHSSNYLAGREK